MSSFFNPGRTPSRPPSLVTFSEESDSSGSWISSSPPGPTDHDGRRIYVRKSDENNDSAGTTTVLNRSSSNNNNDGEAQQNQRPYLEGHNKEDSNGSNHRHDDRDHHDTDQTRSTNVDPRQTNPHTISISQLPSPPHKSPTKSSSPTLVSAQQDETQRRRRAELRDRYYRMNSLLNEYRTWILDYPVEISILEEVLSKLRDGDDGCEYEREHEREREKQDQKFDITERHVRVNNARFVDTKIFKSEEKNNDSTTKNSEATELLDRRDIGGTLSTFTSIQRVERAIDRLREDLDLATLTVPVLEDMRAKVVPEMKSCERSGGSCGSLDSGVRGDDVGGDEDKYEDEDGVEDGFAG